MVNMILNVLITKNHHGLTPHYHDYMFHKPRPTSLRQILSLLALGRLYTPESDVCRAIPRNLRMCELCTKHIGDEFDYIF